MFVCSRSDLGQLDACFAQSIRSDCAVYTEIVDFDPGPGDYARKIQFGYERSSRQELVLLAADDLIFHPGWLEAVERVAGEYDCGVIGTNDRANPTVIAGRHSTHPVVRRCYIDLHGGVVGEPGVVYHEGYDHQYCNPPDAPIWMGDLGFRPLGQVQQGDAVMGWRRIPAGTMTLNALEPAIVLDRQTRQSPIVKVTMESGRTFRCTPDHRWLNAWWSPSTASDAQWVTPEPGRLLLHVVSPTEPVSPEDQWVAGWLAGIYDGEGSGIYAASQSERRNPDVHAAISEALDRLDISHTVSKSEKVDHFWLNGGLQGFVDFIAKVQPVKRAKMLQRIVGGRRFGTRDRIVEVTKDGDGEVISLTTSTGNYVAWGYASRNCDNELVATAVARGCYAHAHTALVEHRHPLYDRRVPRDATYVKGQAHGAEDSRLFESRRHLWEGARV